MRSTAARTDTPPLTLEVIVESPLWDHIPDAEIVIRRAIAGAATSAGRDAAEIAILLTDDSAIREMNRQWRGQDKPTNVLSFPASTGGHATHLGDIAIAYETLNREAVAEEKPASNHLAHLVIHGYLHLLGYDHTTDADATRMEKLETQILEKLGIPDPHAASDPGV
jgi:probable rRNA maturation factor